MYTNLFHYSKNLNLTIKVIGKNNYKFLIKYI